MRTPTWEEVEEFCRKDGWEQVRSTDHTFFHKTLADGTALETHSSFSGQKTMSPGRFQSILRNQLRVSQEDFWATLRTGKPAPRPGAPISPEPPAHPDWVVRVLQDDLGMPDEAIAHLAPDEARRLVEEYWSHHSERHPGS